MPLVNAAIPNDLKHINKPWLEKALSFYVEGPIAPILTNIRSQKNLKNVSESDMIFLLNWMCWIFVANPSSQAVETINNTLGYNAYAENIKQLPSESNLAFILTWDISLSHIL